MMELSQIMQLVNGKARALKTKPGQGLEPSSTESKASF